MLRRLGYGMEMPFKHHAARRHRIPRARYRVTNWPAYEAGLRRRGDLTLWLDQAALAGWAAPKRSTPGGQPRYSDLAVELVLTLRLVFHLALRQAEAFTRSVLALLGLELRVPDHTTLSRRGRTFAGRQPRVRASSGPVHLVLDSTGLELFGQGEWHAAKHGRARRRWMKLHLGVDATTGEVVAHVLTDGHADDAAQAARPAAPAGRRHRQPDRGRRLRRRPRLPGRSCPPAWPSPGRGHSAPLLSGAEHGRSGRAEPRATATSASWPSTAAWHGSA